MLKHILEEKNQIKIKTLKGLSNKNIGPEYLDDLIRLLDDNYSIVRFWSLDLLIKKLGKTLKAKSKRILPKLVNLLVDDNSPVVDRAIWAISITGPKSITYLLDKTKTANDELKIGIIWALTRNHNTNNHLRIVLQELVILLSYKNPKVQYNAFLSIFELIEYKILNNQPIGFDVNEIKKEVKPILEEVLKSEKDESWKNRYRKIFEKK